MIARYLIKRDCASEARLHRIPLARAAGIRLVLFRFGGYAQSATHVLRPLSLSCYASRRRLGSTAAMLTAVGICIAASAALLEDGSTVGEPKVLQTFEVAIAAMWPDDFELVLPVGDPLNSLG